MLELNLNLPLALPPHESTNASGKQRPIKDYYTGKELYELGVKKIPMLVEGLFLKTGIMVLAGSSDVGKSTLARQLILSIAEDRKQFLGWNLNPKYNKAIYVSTEDDSIAISYALNKTVKDEIEKNHLDNIRYVFDST
ncbi:MAG: AAA family ATPase, partial [Methanofastidiosum sp.]